MTDAATPDQGPLPTTPPLAAEDVTAALAPAGKRVLDVGCGDGLVGRPCWRPGRPRWWGSTPAPAA